MADLQAAEEKYKEAVLKRMGEISSRRIKAWKPKEKLNRFRVLRAKAGDPWAVPTVVHFGLGPEGKDRALCNIFAGEDRCEACEEAAKLKASSRNSDQKRADEIKPTHQVLMNILDLEDLELGVQVWCTSESKEYELMEYFVDPEWGDFTHPKEGYEVRMKRTGTGRNDTKYGPIKLAKSPSALSDARTVLGQLKDLIKFYRRVTNEEMRALLDGGDSEGGYACFGSEYSKDDESCDACEKASKCRRVYYEARKAAKAAGNGKGSGKKATARPAPRRFEEDDEDED